MKYTIFIALFVAAIHSISAVSFRGHNADHLNSHEEHRQLMGTMGGGGGGGMGGGGGGTGGGGGGTGGGGMGGGGMGGSTGGGGGMMVSS